MKQKAMTDRRFKVNDEWTSKCYEALKEEYKWSYKVEMNWSGAIGFYKKGSRPCLKNLVCYIFGESYIDFGPNEHLRDTLGKGITQVISKVR